MTITNIFTLAFTFLTLIVQSQDFQFEWNCYSSFGSDYNVTINKNDGKRTAAITNRKTDYKIEKKISESDCNILLRFLENYEYVTKGSNQFKGLQGLIMILNYLWIQIGFW